MKNTMCRLYSVLINKGAYPVLVVLFIIISASFHEGIGKQLSQWLVTTCTAYKTRYVEFNVGFSTGASTP